MAVDQLDLLDLVFGEFEGRLRLVGPDQWTLPTPCEGWDVLALVKHVIDGNALAVQMIEGLAHHEANLGDDPLAAWTRTSGEFRHIVRAPAALERVFLHQPGARGGSDMTVREFVSMKVGGYAVHAWDLARAIGADERLGDEVVEAAYEFYGPKAGTLPEHIYGKPNVDLGEDASVQDRLLVAVGRVP